MTGLYIHIPICVARCRYCDFYTLAPDEWGDVPLFLQALEKELGRLPNDFAPETVFIGGGTPTALSAENYARMLEAIHQRIDLSNVVEFTSEANPGTLTPGTLAAMKSGGINRVSIGVQSFNNQALKLLGRIHDAQEAVDAFHMLRDAEFENVNLDLIQSIPGMSPNAVLADARKAIELSPEHISYYNLIYEPGTPMAQDLAAGKISEPGEDEEADIFFAVKDLLAEGDYEQYEISNFSKDRKRCQHNILYWQGGEYLGCGPSAHSHWNGKRFGNVEDLPAYCDRMLKGEKPFDEVECLGAEDKARELLVMGLRMLDGVDLAEFKRRTGFSVDELCGDAVELMVEEELLQRTDHHLALTREALFVSNSVFSELV